MKEAAALALRTILGIEGILLILRSHQVIATLIQRAEGYGDPVLQYWTDLGPRLIDGAPVFGMCALVTSWGLLSRRRWADRASLIVCLFHIVLFPFFTPAGILGLAVWRRRNRIVDGMSARWHQPLPSSTLPGSFRMLASFAICFGAGTLYALIVRGASGNPDLIPAWTIPLLLGASYGVLSVWHDLGHLLAGRVSGFDFDRIALGGLELCRKEEGGWKLRRRDRSIWRYLHIGARTTRLDRLDSRLVFMQLGGPLFEFAAGLVAFAVSLAHPSPQWREVCGILAVVAFSRYVMEMALEFTRDNDYTDGARLVQLWGRQPEGERWCALHSIAQSQSEPVSPKDWHESWVIRVSADPESPVYPAGCFYAYAHYLDCNNLEKAEEFIERLRSIKGWHNQDRVAAEVAFFEAFTDQRSPAAELRHGTFEPSPSVMRMQAMALVSDGHAGEAKERIQQSRKALGRGGWAIFETRLLGEIERRIEKSREEAANGNAGGENQAPAVAPEDFAQLIRRTAM